MQTSLAFEFPPRERRFQVSVEAELHLFGGRRVGARLRNVSASGFFAELDGNVLTGTQLILIVGGVGEMPAQVRWAFQGRVGGLFNGPVEPALRAAMFRLIRARRAGQFPQLVAMPSGTTASPAS